MSDPAIVATSLDGGATTSTESVAQSQQSQQVAQPAWMAQLPKDLLSDPELSQHEKLENLARSWKEQGGKLKELQDRISKAVALPTQDAKPEDWEKFYAALGRPEKPGDYQLKREGEVANLPKIEGLDEWTAQTYHKLGLTKQQAETLWMENNKKALEVTTNIKAQNEARAIEARKTLETRWGRDYESRRADLEKSVRTFFGESVAKDFLSSPLANNVDFIDRLAGLSKYMSDAPFRGGSPAGTAAKKSAADLIFS